MEDVKGAFDLLDVDVEGDAISDVRVEVTCSFWNNIQRREILLKQKSRVKWCKEGDLNMSFSKIR